MSSVKIACLKLHFIAEILIENQLLLKSKWRSTLYNNIDNGDYLLSCLEMKNNASNLLKA
ncbi:hypothetical protein T01_1150 [Trichinella spiralis]|uniref:Uncharacterized protein n=1 Tax=Trichinella spiralis TaxID=6334 RepID=A0A0V1BZT9_TRISP|nr:hypothetical protein T01_1150 [Trichinella spiralis]